MKKKMYLKQNRKKAIAAALGLATVLSMSACGNEKGGNTPAKEWVYVPTYLTFEDENANLYNMQQVGDCLYYVSNGYNEETMNSFQELCVFSMTDGSLEKKELNWDGEDAGEDKSQEDGEQGDERFMYMQGYTVAPDGSIIANLCNYGWDANDNYSETQSLCKVDADGKKVFEVDLTKQLEESENSYVDRVVVDGEGRIYLLGGSGIWLYEADGTYRGEVSVGMNSWINSAGCGKDGRIYISGYGIGGAEGNALAAVDFDAKKLGEVYKNFPEGNANVIVPGVEQDLLVSDSDALYEYNMETQTRTEVLQWLDCDINGSYVQGFGTMSDGRLFAVINDWQTEDNEIAVLTRTKAEEVVQKETIVIGSLYSSNEVKAAAVNFNKNNEKYRISIRNYVDYSSNSESAYQDGYNRFLSDITSANCPDIIDLSNVNMEQLAAKGVFEDLNPYLDKSSVIKKEDFVENILKGYTIDDKLISIPVSFELTTVLGATEKLGTEKGWTLQEMLAFADKYPEAELFDRWPKESMLFIMLRFNENMFIDWSTGKCKFDTDEFKSLLQFVNRFPDDYDYSEGAASTPTRIQNNEVLLDMVNVYDWDSIQIYWEMFGGDVTCIGFPSSDGRSGTAFMGSMAYAITSKSKNKDGAWAFLESFLTKDMSDFWFGFPTKKSLLNTMKEEAMKVEYVLDENGEVMLDEAGEPMTYGGGGGVGYEDGWEYTFTIPTQKEVDIIMDLIEDAVPVSYGMDEWMEMVQEEAKAFFAGQKSVDEVANIIQGRIKIYVDENR